MEYKMIDLFKDKVYEELDDISQLVEPFEYAINNEISQMPEEINLDVEFFTNLVNANSGRENFYESMRKIVERKASKLGLKNLSEHARTNHNFIKEFFELQIDGELTFNAITKELTGEAKVLKKKVAYEDKEIEQMLINYMESEFSNRLYRPSSISKSRLNEICDLFNATEALKDRSARGKVLALFNKYKDLISDRQLNIRDVELFKRFVDWNIKYVINGSLPSMSNITKVKIMMRNELPIYSIKEEIV